MGALFITWKARKRMQKSLGVGFLKVILSEDSTE